MATQAAIRAERKKACRNARRAQKSVDTSLERLERELKRLLKRKKLLDAEDGVRVVGKWDEVINEIRKFESALANFVAIVSQ